MALRIRFAFAPNSSLGYSIERLSDGLYYDFAGGTFSTAPAAPINTLTAGTGNYVGLYRDTISSTPVAQFSNGEYAINLHNTASSNQVIGVLGAQMYNGDSAPVFAADPWAAALPASYASGTAGAILGGNLDTKVSSRLATTGYANPLTSAQVASAVWDEPKSNHVTSGTFGFNLDAAVSSRSTYAGGPVAGVTAPVTVGTNQDKSGYSITQAFPANFASLTIGAGGAVTVGTNNDKGGYSLSQAFPANFASLAVSAGGAITVGTNNDKAGYALSAAEHVNIAGDVLNASASGYNASGTIGQKINAAGVATDPWSVDVSTGFTGTQAGAILFGNLDAKVSSRLATAGYTPPPTDYQQRGTPVTLPPAPAGYGGLSPSQIATAVWTDTTTSDFGVAGSLGAKLLAMSTAGDPWSTVLPGGYAAGTAGYILGSRLDTNVGSRSTPASAQTIDLTTALPSAPAAGTIGEALKNADSNLDAPVSSRSTYAGGPVASVTGSVGSIAGVSFPANFSSLALSGTGGVTVATNQDKSGYLLGSAGLDAVPVESGINARQALAPILAASAGVVSGAGTGTIVFKGANVATTRIMASTDNSGNRATVVLTLPT